MLNSLLHWGRKMLSQLLMSAFLDQAAHVFDLKGQSQTRTYSMPNLDFRPRLFKRWIALPPG